MSSPVRVRPRWVWGGLLLALAGTCVLGLGVAALSWTLSLVGGALLVLGAGGSLRGGVLHDTVPRPDLGSEARQVVDGTVHAGVAPGPARAGPRARRDAAAVNRRTRELEAAAGRHPGVRWSPAAGWLLLGATAVLTVSQWELVAHTVTGRANSFLDLGVAVLLGLSGVRVVTAPGQHPVAAAVALVGGVVLVLNGGVGEHDAAGPATVEVTCGIVAVLSAVIAWVGGRPGR